MAPYGTLFIDYEFDMDEYPLAYPFTQFWAPILTIPSNKKLMEP